MSTLKHASIISQAGPEESLWTYNLLEALSSDDHKALVPLLKEHAAFHKEGVQTYPGLSSPIHLAIKCAKYPSVELALKYCQVDLNGVDKFGQTPLHLAASQGRTDVVALLLNQPDIDDSVKDLNGKTALDLADGIETANLINVSQAKNHEHYLELLAAYVQSPLPDSTASSRASVHLSPSRASLALPSLQSVSAEALSQPSHETRQVSAASGHVSNAEAERLYHFLHKPRSRSVDMTAWDRNSGSTVLHEAAKRKDLGLIKLALSRGADPLIRDKRKKLPIDLARDERVKSVFRQAASNESEMIKSGKNSNDGVPAPMKGYLTKWTNVARGYKTRWFVLENGILSYYRTQEEEGKASKGSVNLGVAKITRSEPEGLKFEVSNKSGSSFPTIHVKGNHPVEVLRWVDALRRHSEYARGPTLGHSESRLSLSVVGDMYSKRHSSQTISREVSVATTSLPADYPDESSLAGDDENNDNDDETGTLPHSNDFNLLASNARTHLELCQKLAGSLDPKGNSDVKVALGKSLSNLEKSFHDYASAVQAREKYYLKQYERELETKKLWEESVKDLAVKHHAMEVEMEKMGRTSTRRKKALMEVRANLNSPSMSPSMPSFEPPVQELDGLLDVAPIKGDGGDDTIGRNRSSTVKGSSPLLGHRGRSGTIASIRPPLELEQIVESALKADESETDDDEFFEAVEAGQIDVPEEPRKATKPEECPLASFIAKGSLSEYSGYQDLRTQLPIDSDNRPPVSLWAILKGSIGKDLTKISFPVFFNEPTSMLQRMAEDMEFSECLDAAASEPDPTKRVAYVAAFAMSNYSSTIGRIAKPFNPMLGETFEYCNLEKKYRYISEQVCHHPPISACFSQSYKWDYFGEVDAKNKFTGKSFEIRPTGLAQVRLRVPKEWAPKGAPIDDTPGLQDFVTEHYSWNKVTTGVSNFLLGNPIIDHYGDMVVTNHMSGEKCTLTFKPRGWTAANAQEIKGRVTDSQGQTQWDIAGKWSTQLIARRIGAGSGVLAPDTRLPIDTNGDITSEYIRLWKNTEKPTLPFNLTPFATTLNDDNPEIRRWLPPTDCRLRPDQHAFESGDYERANTLKSDLEEHQRETRRMRERGEIPPHRTRWFERKKSDITGENFWAPVLVAPNTLEYWEERSRVGREKEKGVHAEWNGVDPIFGDFQ